MASCNDNSRTLEGAFVWATSVTAAAARTNKIRSSVMCGEHCRIRALSSNMLKQLMVESFNRFNASTVQRFNGRLHLPHHLPQRKIGPAMTLPWSIEDFGVGPWFGLREEIIKEVDCVIEEVIISLSCRNMEFPSQFG